MRNPGLAVPRMAMAAALFAALVASGCSTTSRSEEGESEAAPESGFAREGLYLGLYGIKSYENFHTSGNSVHTGDSDGGIGAKVGFRITPNVAIEAIAENVRGFRVSDGTVDSNLDLLNFGVMGKYYLATERFQPYLVAGAGVARSDVSNFNYKHDGSFLRGGLGMDVHLTQNVAVFGEANYNRMMGGVSDLHHIDLQLGLIFRF